MAPLAALGLLMALSLAALLYVTRGVTFHVTDEFIFAFYRHNWALDTFLLPYNGHLVALPIAVFNVLFDVGGFDDYLPFRLGTMPLTLVSAGLLFMYARRRVGNWPAVGAAAVILFFGAAWQALLVPIGILSFVVPVAAGVAALLALDRGDRSGDALAGAFLVLGLLSQSVALVFLGAVGIELLLGAERRRRLWVVAVPAVLYAAWYAKYGHGGDHPFILEHARHNLAAIPRYALDGIATTFGAVTGPGEIARQLDWSRDAQHAVGGLIAVFGAALLAVRMVRSRAVQPRLWGLIAAFAAFWLFTALARGGSPQAPEQSRYLYPSAVLVLLIAVEALRGVRLTRVAAPVLAGALALSVVPNLIALGQHGGDVRLGSRLVSGKLAALELERSWINSHGYRNFRPGPQLPPAGSYFYWTARYSGSPALDPEQIPALGPGPRAKVDTILVRLLRLRLTPIRGALAESPIQGPHRPGAGDESCVVLRGGSAAAGVEFAAPSAHLVIEARDSTPVQVRVRRFADAFPARVIGNVPAGSVRRLRLPPDDLPEPWRLRLSGGPAVACSAQAGFVS